jgi:hypothetical protein
MTITKRFEGLSDPTVGETAGGRIPRNATPVPSKPVGSRMKSRLRYYCANLISKYESESPNGSKRIDTLPPTERYRIRFHWSTGSDPDNK